MIKLKGTDLSEIDLSFILVCMHIHYTCMPSFFSYCSVYLVVVIIFDVCTVSSPPLCLLVHLVIFTLHFSHITRWIYSVSVGFVLFLLFWISRGKKRKKKKLFLDNYCFSSAGFKLYFCFLLSDLLCFTFLVHPASPLTCCSVITSSHFVLSSHYNHKDY